MDDSDRTGGRCGRAAPRRPRDRAAALRPACSAASARFLESRDQDHLARRQRVHARGPGREHHGRGGENRRHHGRRPVRAAARQDQGGDHHAHQPADQISDQHALSWRSHRRERAVRQGRRDRRRPDNVKKRLAAGTTNGLTGVKTPPAPQGAFPGTPTRTFPRSGCPAALPT